VIAVAAAMQESKLLVHANPRVPASLVLPHERVGSDHDSVGLFQQRGGWGTARVRMDPTASARLFYEALLEIPGWERLPLTQAAQRVQVSAFPDAYARWEDDADELVEAIASTGCRGGTRSEGVPLHVDLRARMVAARAVSQVGVPYVWGGGGAHGPTTGVAPAAARSRSPGFDCSGLMVFAFDAAGVSVPHQTQAIWSRFGPPITDPHLVRAGDMILLSRDGSAGGIHHVGLYLGNGRVVHAPRPGKPVTISDDIWNTAYWSSEFIGAVRAIPAHDRARSLPSADPPWSALWIEVGGRTDLTAPPARQPAAGSPPERAPELTSPLPGGPRD
jgi:cell wall-associated NlpC family hydrolase